MSRKVYVSFHRLRKKMAHTLIHCPSCAVELTLEQLPHHVETMHGIDVEKTCPYCEGRYRWQERKGYSEVNSAHFIECMKKCVADMKVYLEPSPTEVPKDNSILDSCETCKNFNPDSTYLGERNGMYESMGLYKPFFEKLDMWKVKTNLFDEKKGMYNDIVGIVNRFLKNDLDWFRLTVPSDLFTTFIEEMSKISDKIVILPYWCVSISTNNSMVREMILACEKKSPFVRVWKNKLKNDTHQNHICKKMIRIKKPFRLVNAIQSVSRPKSSCDKKSIRDTENDARSDYFYSNKPLSEHAIAFMCLLFSGGVEMLCQHQNMSKNVVDWFGHAKMKYNQWEAPLKVTGFKFLNCVIPLRRDVEPTDEETDNYVIWMNDRKMYLKENPELNKLSDAEWLRYQIRKGNTFRSISDDMYVYVKSQQNVMNQLKTHDKKLMEQCDKKYLETRNTYLDLKRKFSELERETDAEITRLRTQLAMKDDENTQLNAKILSKDAELLAKNAEFLVKNAEISDLKRERRIRY